MKLNDWVKKYDAGEWIECSRGGRLMILSGVDQADYEALPQMLSEFCLADGHKEGKMDFSVLQGEEGVLTASYRAEDQMLRLMLQPGEKLPVWDAGEAICKPLLTQMKLSYYTDDCGMCYVIRLQDGRFILIDGGMGKYDEAGRLLNILREQNVLPKIRIAAWFFSHPHDDHIGGFTALMEQSADELDLEYLIYNWPMQKFTGNPSPLDRFDALIAGMEEKVVTAHSGQRYSFPGVQMDVLFTCDDLYPNTFPNINDSSMVLRMTMEGRRVIFPGDGQEMCSAELCARYGTQSLKAEILQVPHHGYWGGSTELFTLIDPETVLWPCPDFWYQEIQNWECNRFFKESKNIRQILVGGQQEVVLDMTQPVPKLEAYPPVGAVLVDEHFDHGSMVKLNFSCVTGGSTGYRAAVVAFDGKVGTFTAGEANSVIEILQPGRLQGVEKLRLIMKGKVLQSPEILGIWVNHARPTQWSEEDILPLQAQKDGMLDVDWTLERQDGCGLYLIMKAGSLALSGLKVMKTEA